MTGDRRLPAIHEPGPRRQMRTHHGRGTRTKCPVVVVTRSAEGDRSFRPPDCRSPSGKQVVTCPGRPVAGPRVTLPKDLALTERDVIITFRDNHQPDPASVVWARLSRGNLDPATASSPGT